MTNSEQQLTDKKQIFYNKYIGNFATPKKFNRSTKVIPQTYIDSLEAGDATSDTINKLSEIVPIYVYKTCITIHGNFPDIQIQRIGSYKNIIQNANGSVELRYSAIDYSAKKEIASYLNNEWSANQNSTAGIYYQKSFRTQDRQEALNVLKRTQQEVKDIQFIGMFAKIYVQGFSYFGMYYIITVIEPLTITGDPLHIASQITGENTDQIKERMMAKQAEQDKREHDAQQRREQMNNAKLQAEKCITETYNTKPQSIIPDKIGSVYITPTVTVKGSPMYRFYRVESKGSFGRMVLSTYASENIQFTPDKLQPFMKGKQVSKNDIINTTYLIM